MALELTGTQAAAHATPRSLETIKTVELYGAPLAALTEADCVRLIGNELQVGHGGWLVTMNLDHLRRFAQGGEYAARVLRASLRVADGMPLVWASRLQGIPLPERVTGSNLIWSLSQRAETSGHSVFLLGGTPRASVGAARVLRERYPRLKLAGVFCPGVGFEQRSAELEQLTQAVVDAQPDIVYVALSSPKEDDLIDALRVYLPHTWWLGVGISFSFVTGEVTRAPHWMQQAGFEWLHRLVQEPRRLYKRYLVQSIPFAIILFAYALCRRLFAHPPAIPRPCEPSTRRETSDACANNNYKP